MALARDSYTMVSEEIRRDSPTLKKLLEKYLRAQGVKRLSPYVLVNTAESVIHMTETLGHPIEFMSTIVREYYGVFSLYSNYDIQDIRLDSDKEERVLNFLRRHIGDMDLTPMWFFDNEYLASSRNRPRTALSQKRKNKSLLYGPQVDSQQTTLRRRKSKSSEQAPSSASASSKLRKRSTDAQREETLAIATRPRKRTRGA